MVVEAAVAEACLRMLRAWVDAGREGLWKRVITSRVLGWLRLVGWLVDSINSIN